MRKPRMTVGYVAAELMRDFPDLFCHMEPFARKKRLIGIVNDAMSREVLAWIIHRGQRRITPDGLDAYIQADHAWFAETCAVSKAAAAEVTAPIAERYPLPKPRQGKKRRPTVTDDRGPSLAEIE